MEIGKRIQKKREAQGLSRLQLARKVGCSTALIEQIEAGTYPHTHGPKLSVLKRVLKVRVRGVSPKKAAGRVRKPVVRKSGPATAPDTLLKAIAGLHLAVSALSTQVARLSAKVSVPSRMLRSAPVAPSAAPVSEANGTSHPLANEPQPTPEALAA